MIFPEIKQTLDDEYFINLAASASYSSSRKIMTYPIRTFEYAEIVNVVDGDTVDIVVDLGFSVKVKQRFRLIRIDTPERGQTGFNEAKNFLTQYLNVPVVLAVTKLDKYGRYLVEITYNGVNLNDALLNAGLAVPYV
jgi:micrococcal nuclease